MKANVTCPVCKSEWLVLSLLPSACAEYTFYHANGYLLIVCDDCDHTVDWDTAPSDWFSVY